jgi:thioredoxin reductase (NADPH)
MFEGDEAMEITDKSEIRNPESEIVIVGGGVAGLSTALWCEELGLSAVLFEQRAEFGGQLLWVHNEIKNYLGVEAANGRALRDAFLEQTAARRFERRLAARVRRVDLSRKEIVLDDGTRVFARAVVIATGIRRRALNVAGEEEFRGRGILESGKAEAESVAGKKVLIVGGGDAAFENALILAAHAESVALVHRRKSFRAREEFVEQVRNHPKVTILTDSAVAEIAGGARVERVGVKNLATGETRTLPIDAVLIRAGVEPNTEIFRGQLRLDRGGYIEVGRDCETSVAGVFAVGDVASPTAPTIATAAGMGATAAKAILSWFDE